MSRGWIGSGPEFGVDWGGRTWTLKVDDTRPGLRVDPEGPDHAAPARVGVPVAQAGAGGRAGRLALRRDDPPPGRDQADPGRGPDAGLGQDHALWPVRLRPGEGRRAPGPPPGTLAPRRD